MSNNLIITLNNILLCCGLIGLISTPFLLINWVIYIFDKENTARRFPLKSVLFFSIPIFVAIIMSDISTYIAKNEALTFINEQSDNYTVLINGKPTSQSDKVINLLKNMYPNPGQHSHPTKIIKVEIQSEKGSLQLELQRDSVTKQEYWVYYPQQSGQLSTKIGGVTTSQFDGY